MIDDDQLIYPPLDDQVWDFFQSITVPRQVGTEAHLKVQNIIKTAFSNIKGTSVTEQPFPASRAFINGLLNLINPTIGLLMIVCFIFISQAQYQIGLVFNCILLVFTVFNQKILNSLDTKVQKLGKKYPAKNIIAEISPTGGGISKSLPSNSRNPYNLVLLAHFDSISYGLGPKTAVIINVAGFIGGIIYSIHLFWYLITILAFGQEPASLLTILWGVIVGCIACLKILNFNGNKSHGALDNASGVTQLYDLARKVSEKPLKNLNLTLVATDGEELGNMGAHAFIREYKNKLPKDTTKFLIIDSIGAKDNNVIVYGAGIPLKHYSLSLETLIRNELDISGVPCSMQALPPFIEVSSDHAVIHKAGYDLIWFTSISINFHTKNDTLDNMDKENFTQIVQFIEKIIRSIDKGIK